MGRYKCADTGKGHYSDYEYCEECFQKQIKIDRQAERIKQLEAQLRYRKKKDNQEFFGSSTPSSKKSFKENSDEENKKNVGGAKPGHKGNGRKSFSEEEADEVENRPVNETICPNCGGQLEHKGIETRSVIDMIFSEVKKILVKYQIKQCRCCKKTVENKPLILPRNLYGNALIIDSMLSHYIHGVPIKRIEEMAGPSVAEGSLIKSFHRIAESWEDALKKLKEEFKHAEVKHADETGWRTDGDNGYAWLFATKNLSIFEFKDTRSSKVPLEIMGTESVAGVLVVDRYAGYNKVPCKIQYCYAHLLRALQDIEKESPIKEVKRFVGSLAPLIAEAMKLRNAKISDTEYYDKAQQIKMKIMEYCRAPAKKIAIQNYQNIFIENENRLFHWVENRNVPAENNRAERELRPTVIARKVSFGSQSTKGAKTRGAIMSILHTAAKRLTDQSLQSWLKSVFEAYIKNPKIDIYSLLPPIPD